MATATTITVTSSLNPAVVGQAVTFTATVTPGAATGTVTFFNQGNLAGNVKLVAGVAVLTLAALTSGSHTISVAYNGDAVYSPSVGALATNPQVMTQPVAVVLQPFNTLSLAAATPKLLVAPSAGNFTVQMLCTGTGPVLISKDPAFGSAYTLAQQVPFAVSIWGPSGIWVSAAAAESLSVALIPNR